MADYEEQLLREMLMSAYHDIVPEHSTLGTTLVRKLAAGLYARGGRIVIGPPKTTTTLCYISVDYRDTIVWTCKELHRVLGYQPQSMIGQSIYNYLPTDVAQFRREIGLRTLIQTGKLGPLATCMIAADGRVVVGSGVSTTLKASDGSFYRTFTRIKLVTSFLLAAVGCWLGALGVYLPRLGSGTSNAYPPAAGADQRPFVLCATHGAGGSSEQLVGHD